MTTILSLIGEQPIPNLLPIRYLNPRAAILVHSDFTEKSAKQLTNVIHAQLEVSFLPVDAYQIDQIQAALKAEISRRNLDASQVVFNLTGGTLAPPEQLGSLLAGCSVVLSAIDTGIAPSSGMSALLIATISVIVGGTNAVSGGVAGGFLIGVVENVGIWKIASEWKQAIAFGVLAAFILLRPTGLLGPRQAK